MDRNTYNPYAYHGYPTEGEPSGSQPHRSTSTPRPPQYFVHNQQQGFPGLGGSVPTFPGNPLAGDPNTPRMAANISPDALRHPMSFGYAPPVSYGYFDAGYGAASQPGSALMLGTSLPKEEELESEAEGEELLDEEGIAKRSGSGSADEKPAGNISPKKKPRVTLARGGACVACRNRKLKCTGERPCKICRKTGIECRYEDLPRKKPRNVLLEERVVELEALLLSKGDTLPPSALGPPPPNIAFSTSSGASAARPSPGKDSAALPATGTKTATSASSTGIPTPSSSSNQSRSVSQPVVPSSSLHSHRDLSPAGLSLGPNAHGTDILPGSPLEMVLINTVLPYLPHLAVPIHPQRLQAVIALPVTDPSRPHPALMYILFAEAVRILERKIPPPRLPPRPPFFPSSVSTLPASPVDSTWIMAHVQGSSVSLMERARTELDAGIRNVDRPLDLARAAICIARYLYSLGRFIEGWAVPVSRLVISCGLHRLTGNVLPPEPGAPTELVPRPFASTEHYANQHAMSSPPPQLPVLRMRPIIVPPPRDEIDLAERVATFWAAKGQDWSAGIGWGWTTSMADEECTTEWPWGWGQAEMKNPAQVNQRFGIRDLLDVGSPMHSNKYPDSTYTLAMQSLCLLHRASHLFDRPESSYPIYQADGRLVPTHIPPLAQIRSVDTALSLLRKRIPLMFAYPPSPLSTPVDESPSPGVINYDGPADPWWVLLHTNLYTAEMLMWREMAHYEAQAYERAVSCARAVVGFVSNLRPESWIHADMAIALDLSLVARFLFKESDRLRSLAQHQTAGMAADEADMLRQILARDYAQWMPMASLHALIVQRVREGWAEKEGEYERV